MNSKSAKGRKEVLWRQTHRERMDRLHARQVIRVKFEVRQTSLPDHPVRAMMTIRPMATCPRQSL